MELNISLECCKYQVVNFLKVFWLEYGQALDSNLLGFGIEILLWCPVILGSN